MKRKSDQKYEKSQKSKRNPEPTVATINER